MRVRALVDIRKEEEEKKQENKKNPKSCECEVHKI